MSLTAISSARILLSFSSFVIMRGDERRAMGRKSPSYGRSLTVHDLINSTYLVIFVTLPSVFFASTSRAFNPSSRWIRSLKRPFSSTYTGRPESTMLVSGCTILRRIPYVKARRKYRSENRIHKIPKYQNKRKRSADNRKRSLADNHTPKSPCSALLHTHPLGLAIRPIPSFIKRMNCFIG